MDAMVSARVPVEVKKQGDRKLKEIGSSATELVNAAYSYLIETGELPMKRSLQVASKPPSIVFALIMAVPGAMPVTDPMHGLSA